MSTRRLAVCAALAVTLASCTGSGKPNEAAAPSASASPTSNLQTVAWGRVAVDVPKDFVINGGLCTDSPGVVLLPNQSHPFGSCATSSRPATIVQFQEIYKSKEEPNGEIDGHPITITNTLNKRFHTHFDGLGLTVEIHEGTSVGNRAIQDSMRVIPQAAIPEASSGHKRVAYGPVSVEVPETWPVGPLGGCTTGNQVLYPSSGGSPSCGSRPTATPSRADIYVEFVSLAGPSAQRAAIEREAKTPATVTTTFEGATFDALVGTQSRKGLGGTAEYLVVPALGLAVIADSATSPGLREILDTAVISLPEDTLTDDKQVKRVPAGGMQIVVPSFWDDDVVKTMIPGKLDPDTLAKTIKDGALISEILASAHL